MVEALPSVAFLGAGSMGGAILRGLVASAIPVDGGITATNRTSARAAELEGLPGVRSIALEQQPDGNAVAAGARIVVVGVKPAMVPDLLDQIAPHLREDAIVVSIAAGVTLATFAAHLPAGTSLAAAADVTDEERALVRRLFETVGSVIEVAEEQIDPLSTISGSGPAYVFLLIEEFTKAAMGKGFAEPEARLMAEQTFIGATALLEASGEDPAELRRRVTSPKGTTERAIAVLQDADLDGLFARATDAALARARELAAGA